MAISTSLNGPYDAIITAEKTRIMCGVPTVVLHELFSSTFARRGVQDKILARMFHIFWMEVSSKSVQAELTDCTTSHDREEVLNKLLNKLALLQSLNENQDVTAPTDATPNSPA